MWLKACLNGNRQTGVPTRPQDLAADAVAVRAAGANAVHVHPRDENGQESLVAADLAATVEAIRSAAPELPIGVSTGLWITGGDVHERLEAVRTWGALPAESRPDFASCNVSEEGFQDLALAVEDAGIAVEAGVWSPADADALAASGTADRALRILVEVFDVPAETASGQAALVLARLDDLGLTVPRLLHGEGPTTWPLIDEAIRLGLPTRIGLEDVLHDPDGHPVTTNADLVRLVLARSPSAGTG
jgi:uncharacterized protein (DUF849 family)